MVLRSHFSQFLMFCESSTSSAIPDGVAKFLESLCNSSGSRRACWRSKTFPGILIFSRVFRSIPTSRPGFLELEVIRAWWETWYCHNCSVCQESLKNRLTVRDSWSCCVRNSSHLRCLFCNFLPDSSMFSILQFLGTFLHSFLDEDGPSSPICYTNVFSHVELHVELALIGFQ